MKRISLSRSRLLKIAVATLIVVLIVSVVYLMKHQSNPNHEKEQYPPSQSWVPAFNVTLNIGDSWKLNLTIDESEYNLTMTVTGNETVHDVSCYVVSLIFEPENPKAETGISNEMTAWLDKSTLNIVQLKGTGNAQGFDFRYTETHSYTFFLQEGGPSMTVGTEYDQNDTKTIDIDVKVIPWPEVWQDYPPEKVGLDSKSTKTTHIKVEAVENVNVTAGKFSCYKIVTYDETGQNPLSTRWFSIEAKTVVKSVDHETGEKSELLSYSI